MNCSDARVSCTAAIEGGRGVMAASDLPARGCPARGLPAISVVPGDQFALERLLRAGQCHAGILLVERFELLAAIVRERGGRGDGEKKSGEDQTRVSSGNSDRHVHSILPNETHVTMQIGRA